MKKIVLLLAIMILPVICFAKEYQVDDINLKVGIPDDYIVLTRDNLKDNSDMKELGISEEYMVSAMNLGNIYLDIIAKDISYEILVIVPKIDIAMNTLANVSDSMLKEVLEAMKEKTGATIGSVYKSNYNYTMVEYYDSKMNYNIVNYYTVVNAKGYNIQLQKKGTITEEEKNNLKNIVDSVNIKVLDQYKENKKTEGTKSFNWKKVIIGTIVGAAAGGVGSTIGLLIKKKMSKTSE